VCIVCILAMILIGGNICLGSYIFVRALCLCHICMKCIFHGWHLVCFHICVL